MAGSDRDPQEQGPPRPDPALKRLERFVGAWDMTGHLVGSGENNITGRAVFSWLPGGFFLEQQVEINFMGNYIHSLELIGYEPGTDTFPSTVYSNQSPAPLPYRWDVRGDTVTISVIYGAMDSTFTGKFSPDGRSFSGGWRPNPGADPAANVSYDIGGSRA